MCDILIKKQWRREVMSIDKLQERIRKTKNPAVLELRMTESDIPHAILSASDSVAVAMGFFCR